MKIKESKLYKVHYCKTFNTVCDIKDIPLVLDTIEVYALNEEYIDKKVAFDIVVNSEEKYIIPRCNLEKYNSFLLTGYRVAIYKTIEMKASEYIKHTKDNGNITITVLDQER